MINLGPDNDELSYVLAISRQAAINAGASDEEADDAAQSFGLRVLCRWNDEGVRRAREAGDARWKKYLWVSAKRVHFSEIRSHRRRRKREVRAAGALIEPLPERPGTLRPPSPSTVALPEAFLGEALIKKEIERLPEQQRDCAWAVLIAGDTPREVADRRGVQPQTVRKHLRQAVETILAQIEQDLRN